MGERESLLREIEALRARNAELERAAEEAKKIQADLEALIENTDDFILFSDAQAQPVVFNSNYARVMKQMLGIEMKPGFQPHTLLESADDRAFWEGLHRRVLAGEKFKAEFSYTVGERELFFEVAYNPVFRGERVVGFSEYTRDITERKRVEAALREAQQRSEYDYRLLLEKMPDGVIIHEVITDDEGRPHDYRALEVNPAFERITGFSREHVIGHTIREMLPAARDEWMAGLAKVVESGEPVRVDVEMADLGLTLDMTALRPHPGQLVCIFQDITHRRELEEQRQRAERLESVGLLAGGIAHDFNNILTSLLGNLELARIEVREASRAQTVLAEAVKACERASALTKQLLTFSRGGQPIKMPSHLGPLLEEWSAFVLRGSNVSCRPRAAADLWPVEIDAGQISQVVHNLLVNADHAMPEGGVIELVAENVLLSSEGRPHIGAAAQLPPGRYVRFTVRDQGSGIEKNVLSKIFDPYFTTKEKGSGLGLATCYAIVRNHHGAIGASSELGSGTTFEVLLPAMEGEVALDVKSKREPTAGAGRVLFMDDDEAVRDVARGLLEYLGYEVELVADGQAAIDAYGRASARGESFSAVILDLTVPGGLGGKETISELRRIDPRVRAIVSSGYCSDPVLANFRDYGFEGMVAKPYELDALARVLNRVLSSSVEGA